MRPEECTINEVFEHIKRLNDHSADEICNGVDYLCLPMPFCEDEDYHAEEYYPIFKKALGLRHHEVDDSPKDLALSVRHSTEWYYFAVRVDRRTFTIVKARSPSPCPALVARMLKIGGDIYGSEDMIFILLSTPCEAHGSRDAGEPQEGQGIARRLWHAALCRGGSVTTRAKKFRCSGSRLARVKDLTWMRMPGRRVMDALWTEYMLCPPPRHLALMRKLRAASSIVAPLLKLYEEVREKAYAPDGAGYKRARDEFESHQQA